MEYMADIFAKRARYYDRALLLDKADISYGASYHTKNSVTEISFPDGSTIFLMWNYSGNKLVKEPVIILPIASYAGPGAGEPIPEPEPNISFDEEGKTNAIDVYFRKPTEKGL